MATLTLVSLASKNSHFPTMYFPATCPKGTKSSSGSYYWCPDQLLFRNGQYVRCHLIGSKAATTYGTGDPGKLYNGTIYATTAYQAESVGPLGDVNLETLEATIFYKDDLTATQYAVVESVTGHTHDVQRGTGCKSISFSELNVKGFWHVGTRYFRSGTRTYTAAPQEGYRAVQWTHDIGTVDDNGKLVVDCSVGPLTATASFSPLPTLSYNANGGSPTPETQTAYGEVTIAAAPARQGYAFAGWSIGGETYQPGDAYTLHESATATAQWRKVSSISASADVPSSFSGTPPAIEIAPPADAETGGWTEGTRITAAAPAQLLDSQGNVQCAFVSWRASANVELPSPATNPVVEFDMPGSDVTLTANYVLREMTVTCEVDPASAGKVNVGYSPSSVTLRYGNTVTFTASNVAPDHDFAGWYDAQGVLVSTSTEYNVILRKDIALRAKVKAHVSVEWGKFTDGTMGPDPDSHGTLILGSQSAAMKAEGDFVLGSEVVVGYALPEGDGGSFGGWFEGDNRITLDSLGNGRFKYVVTGPAALYATYNAQVEYSYVSLHAHDENGDVDPSLGDFAMESAEGGKVVEMSKEDWKTASRISQPHGDGRFYRVAGVQAVKVRVYKTGSVPFSAYEWHSYLVSGTSPTPLAMNVEAEITKTIDGNCWLGVTFAAKTSRMVTARHDGDGVDVVARGTLELEDARDVERDVNGRYVSGLYDDDATATVVARPANGFKFAGWYSDETQVSTSARYSFTVNGVNTTLTAKFEEDSMGIMLWEGSDENMEMEWTSKVYVTPKPFDPVTARVDATGYPVSLDVGTMSSPAAVPTRPHPIEVASQDGRRLPRMRPERFVRFTVRASHEIDAVVVGTNMAEVN